MHSEPVQVQEGLSGNREKELQYCMGENENVLKAPRCRGLFVFYILQYFLDERNVKNVHISEKYDVVQMFQAGFT